MSFVNKDSIMSSFTICIPVISFTCLIALVRISSTTLKSSGERGDPCFIPDVSGKFFTIKYDINSKFSSYSFFFLNHDWVLEFVKCQMLLLLHLLI